MDRCEVLRQFFDASGKDPRITAFHISLYCALYQRAVAEHSNLYTAFIKSEIMRDAKISGLTTFHRCIKELHSYGYITYQPSYYRKKKNKVYLSKSIN